MFREEACRHKAALLYTSLLYVVCTLGSSCGMVSVVLLGSYRELIVIINFITRARSQSCDIRTFTGSLLGNYYKKKKKGLVEVDDTSLLGNTNLLQQEPHISSCGGIRPQLADNYSGDDK